MNVGIRREDKNQWERRVPLTPAAVAGLIAEGTGVRIQPSPIRAYTDDEYRAAGASLQEDLHDCGLILAVKEIPVERLQPRQSYLFFSHTIKGQAYNMPLLKRLMELRCQLFDYERVTDAQGRRLIFFGRFAGVAGMIDTLWALGQRLAHDGITDLFADVRMAHAYGTLEVARQHIRELGARIATDGVPPAVAPLVFGIAGYGNVSRGAQEILDLLPHDVVEPAELLSRWTSGTLDPHRVHKVVFKEEDMVEPLRPGAAFDLQDYYDHPEHYRSRFASYLPALSVLVNCIYWEPRYPRLVTCDDVRAIVATGARRLTVIGDISCDIGGSVECTVKATDPGDPVYVYEPETGGIVDGVAGHGPVIMAVDNLPCELSRDASEEFSRALAPFVPALAGADYSREFTHLDVPAEFKRSLILHHGELTPDYVYLKRFL